jgi:hypothetical protein
MCKLGEAPITKNSSFYCKSNTKGRVPITKNIIVIDEQGNQYENTYPKRAKGLVKSGRARLVSENTICLACPPNKIWEDLKMSNKNIKPEDVTVEIPNEVKEEIAKNVKIGGIIRDTAKKQTPKETNMSDNMKKKEQVFTQIAELQKDLESIDKLLFSIQCVSDSQQYVESDDGDPLTLDYMPEVALEKIKAMREIVMSREHTINSMLSFYLSVYNELKDAEKE